jgi:hypothetical protein
MIRYFERRPRKAEGVQLTDSNAEFCASFIGRPDLQFHKGSIIVRRNGTHIQTLNTGDWALRGQDNCLRIMKEEELVSKYREVDKDNLAFTAKQIRKLAALADVIPTGDDATVVACTGTILAFVVAALVK